MKFYRAKGPPHMDFQNHINFPYTLSTVEGRYAIIQSHIAPSHMIHSDNDSWAAYLQLTQLYIISITHIYCRP